ncbi:hypothetical protein FRC04_001477 [Tulasnella sp. 424]|nr:hypothetical protein FRC04_001477 [Tulasnella sp. 424]
MGRDTFVSRVWQRRQQKANKARGIVPPPAVLPAGAAQVQVAPAVPSLPAGPVTFQQPTATIPQNGAAPPTTLDIEATAGHDNDPPQQGSSDPMTSPASPPPSALPSWIQPSTIIGSEPGQLPNATTGSNAPIASVASPQDAANPS